MNEKTISLMMPSLEAAPQNWELRLHLAELYRLDGKHSEAATLVKEGRPFPEDEEIRLTACGILATDERDLALELLDQIISANKACARAYLQKADIYRARGMEAEARKNYNVAAVIDESLEDPDFEAWLDGTDSAPPAKVEKTPLAATHSALPFLPDTAEVEKVEPDDFIETDSEVDEMLAQQDRLIDFSDIGGMEALKERIRMSIIYPFKNKDLFKKFKKRSGGGLLFYGPPGCGKTLISRATAGECGAHFINISIHDILSKWIGESEQKVHELFTTARRKAPTIIFIDEVDALGVKRSDAGHTASLVNTLLTEIDGASSNNEDVLVIGATNTPWRIDSAFRRPGRFDHVLFVPPPDQEARESIFQIMLDDIPQEKLDFKKLAKASEKFSGADIRSAVEKASESVIQEIMRTGKEGIVTQKQLLASLKTTRPTTLEWLEQASNYASYANQSGLYDDLSDYLKKA
jgi:SpoVK/Ycf46/Vps4 family AAA+-type ATPase